MRKALACTKTVKTFGVHLSDKKCWRALNGENRWCTLKRPNRFGVQKAMETFDVH